MSKQDAICPRCKKHFVSIAKRMHCPDCIKDAKRDRITKLNQDVPLGYPFYIIDHLRSTTLIVPSNIEPYEV